MSHNTDNPPRLTDPFLADKELSYECVSLCVCVCVCVCGGGGGGRGGYKVPVTFLSLLQHHIVAVPVSLSISLSLPGHSSVQCACRKVEDNNTTTQLPLVDLENDAESQTATIGPTGRPEVPRMSCCCLTAGNCQLSDREGGWDYYLSRGGYVFTPVHSPVGWCALCVWKQTTDFHET